jgi:hypothetical protein
LRKQLRILRVRRRMAFVLTVVLAMPVLLAPHAASAGIFDFLFGGDKPSGMRRSAAVPEQRLRRSVRSFHAKSAIRAVRSLRWRPVHDLLRAQL